MLAVRYLHKLMHMHTFLLCLHVLLYHLHGRMCAGSAPAFQSRPCSALWVTLDLPTPRPRGIGSHQGGTSGITRMRIHTYMAHFLLDYPLTPFHAPAATVLPRYPMASASGTRLTPDSSPLILSMPSQPSLCTFPLGVTELR